VKLYDKAGAEVEVPDADAPAALSSGQYGLPAGTGIPVKGQDGSIVNVPIEQAPTAFARGATVANPEEVHKADVHARHGGAWGAANAAADAFLRGPTLGLSDNLGLESKKNLDEEREEWPLLSAGAELGGLGLSTIATGGESAAARGAVEGGAIADAAGAAGGAGSLLRTAGRVISAPAEIASGVGGAFERGVGGLVGTEATSLAGRIAQRGAALGARGAAEGAIYGAVPEVSEEMLGPAPLNAEKIWTAASHGAMIGLAGGGLLGAGGELGSEVVGKLATKLSGAAEETAAKALGSAGKSVLEAAPGGAKAVGRELLERDLVRAGDTAEDVAQRVNTERAKVEGQLTKMVDDVDAATGYAHPAPAETRTIDDFRSFVSTPEGKAKLVEAIQADPSVVGQLEKGAVPPGVLPPLAAERNLAEDLKRLGGMKTIEAKMGEDFAKDFQSTRDSLARLTVADDAAAKAVATKGPLGSLSLGSLAGMAMGFIHGSSPVGLATGLASSLAHHYVSARGVSTAAVALDRIAQLGAVRRAVAAADREVAAGVRQVAGLEGARPPALHENVGTYAEKRAAVARAASDPQLHRDAVDVATRPLAAHAPETAAALRSSVTRATTYLAGEMPPETPVKSLIPEHDAPTTTPDVQAAFVRKYDAVNDPVILLQHTHDGSITPDEIEAVEKTHPEWLADTRKEMLSALRSVKKPLTQGQKESISVFLGQPVDESVSPTFVQAAQASFGAPPEPPTPGPAGKPGRKTGMGANRRGGPSGVHTGPPKRTIKAAENSSLDHPYGG
jgi:hypothetical protein